MWSLPPIKGDLPAISLFTTTVVVSVKGIINNRITITVLNKIGLIAEGINELFHTQPQQCLSGWVFFERSILPASNSETHSGGEGKFCSFIH